MNKIYKLTQNVNNHYDTYDSCIVCAENEEKAKYIHPSLHNWDGTVSNYDGWCDVKDVNVKEIGIANEEIEIGVILASYNAG